MPEPAVVRGLGSVFREAPEPWMAEGSVHGCIHSGSRKTLPNPLAAVRAPNDRSSHGPWHDGWLPWSRGRRVVLSGNRHEYVPVGCPPPSMAPELPGKNHPPPSIRDCAGLRFFKPPLPLVSDEQALQSFPDPGRPAGSTVWPPIAGPGLPPHPQVPDRRYWWAPIQGML